MIVLSIAECTKMIHTYVLPKRLERFGVDLRVNTEMYSLWGALQRVDVMLRDQIIEVWRNGRE